MRLCHNDSTMTPHPFWLQVSIFARDAFTVGRNSYLMFKKSCNRYHVCEKFTFPLLIAAQKSLQICKLQVTVNITYYVFVFCLVFGSAG